MHVVTSAGHPIDTPSHVSSGSHEVSVEARHDRPVASTRSAGQSGAEPQISGASHAPTEARHTTPSKKTRSQSAEVPLQWSAASHSPLGAVPQSVVAGAKRSTGHGGLR